MQVEKQVNALEHEILVKLADYVLWYQQVEDEEFRLTCFLFGMLSVFGKRELMVYIREITDGIMVFEDSGKRKEISKGLAYEPSFVRRLLKKINRTGVLEIRFTSEPTTFLVRVPTNAYEQEYYSSAT